MEGFSTSLDIGNKALQHVGATRIDAWDEDTKNAAAVRFAYDKVRVAELRRSTWRFATKKAALRPLDTNSLLVTPSAWSAVIVYQPGAVVTHGGALWVSTVPMNVNQEPNVAPSWDIYFGPLVASPYDSTTTYSSAEITYIGQMAGLVGAYGSVVDSNAADPDEVEAWDDETTYSKGQVVEYNDYFYQSLIDLNLNFVPDVYDQFNLATTYALDDIVAGADGKLYLSKADNNLGHEPSTSDDWWVWSGGYNPWTANFHGSITSNKWVRQRGTLEVPRLVYPIGTGPASERSSRNVYQLPNGFLRLADQFPGERPFSHLGGPSGISDFGWVQEGNYLLAPDSGMISVRFVADVSVVPKMDALFCQALAARLGMDICEELTQSATKLRTVSAIYEGFMRDARLVNAIETGPIEPPEDDFITIRR